MGSVSVDSTPEIEAVLHDQIRNILEQKAYEVENVAKRLVASGGGGEHWDGKAYVYRKGGKLYSVPAGQPHTAGAPGTPPATSSGRLLGSINHSLGEDGGGQYARVGSSVYYAIYVELGTRLTHGPHPFLRPALYAVLG